MFSPRWRKVIRDVWLHKPRTFMVVMAISIGIIGAGSVLNTWSLIRSATRDQYRASNPASATIHLDSIDDELLRRVRAQPAIAFAERRRTIYGRIRTPGGWRTLMLFVTTGASNIGRLKKEAGEWPTAVGSMAIEASAVEFSELGVGERVQIRLGDRNLSLAISGIARDVGLPPGWMDHVVYGFATPATLAAAGVPQVARELQLVPRANRSDRDAVRRVAYDVKRLAESAGHRVTDVEVPVPFLHPHAAQIDSLLFTQGAFGVLALLLSSFLVVNLISAMLAGQVREIGIMKAIGARGPQIARMYLVVAAALGLIGCLVSVPVAAFIGRGYAGFTAEILNFDIEGVAVPWWSFALQILVGAVLPVAAAAIPVRRGCRVSAAEALRDVGVTLSAGDSAAFMRRLPWLSRPVLLSLRNAFRRRQRLILTLITLATGGAVFLAARNLRRSVIESVDLIFAPQQYDLSVRFSTPHAPDSIVTAIGSVPGVARSEAWHSVRGARVRNDGTLGDAFSVTGAPADTKLLQLTMLDGRGLRDSDSAALIVTRRLVADDSTFKVGTRVDLMVDGRLVKWTVVGVVAGGPSDAAYVTREALAATTGERGAGTAVIATAFGDDSSHVQVLRSVRSALVDQGLDPASGQLMSEQRRIIEDHLLTVVDFLGVMGQLMIVVGGLGLASTMSLAVLERTREIGVLRAIGAPHGAILAMVQIEGLVIALLSWVIALPLSVPLSAALGQAFGRIFLSVPLTLLPEATGTLWWLGVVVTVSVAACAWPALAAMRVTTAAALSYE
jgi:putative ABC transport system permease protein